MADVVDVQAGGSQTDTVQPTALRKNAIGLREVTFQSVTDMAPGAAIAASIPAGAAWAAGALPLAVLFALVASLLTAICVAELVTRIPSAGSMGTYAAKGLHPWVGFLVGWGYNIAAALIAPLVLVQLGFTVAATLHSEWGVSANLWWPWSLAGAAIIFVFGVLGITASARLGSILGAFEIAVFLAIAIFFIVHAGSHNTLEVFTTKFTPAAHKGLSGVFAASVFTVLAFAGFTGAAPLAEEARDPKKTVRRAVLLSVVLIGALYVFTSYAISVAFGPGHMVGFTSSGPNSWEGLASALYGVAWVFIFFAIVNSTVANANAGMNITTRTSFAFGRIGVLPNLFSALNKKHAPWVAVAVSSAFTVAITLGLGFAYGTTDAFDMFGTGIVVILAGIYIVIDASCIGYFLRHRESLNPLLHIVIPILGMVAFVPAWLDAAGIKVFNFITPLPPPISYMAIAVGIWMLIGVGFLVFHQRRHPERVSAMGDIHVDMALVDHVDTPPLR